MFELLKALLIAEIKSESCNFCGYTNLTPEEVKRDFFVKYEEYLKELTLNEIIVLALLTGKEGNYHV